MNSRIVFYTAAKTSYCEKTLRRCAAGLDVSVSGARYATESQSLGAQLIEAFDDCDIVFVIGGLDFTDRRCVRTVLSNAVSRRQPDEIKRIKNEGGSDACLIRSGGQLLVLLPDDPEQLEHLLKGVLAQYLRVFVKSA